MGATRMLRMTCLTREQLKPCKWASLRSRRRRLRPHHQRKFSLMNMRWVRTRKTGSKSTTLLSHRSVGRWLQHHHGRRDRARLWPELMSCCRPWKTRSINTMMLDRAIKGTRHWSSIAKLPMKQLKIWIYKKKETKGLQWRSLEIA